MQRKPKRFYLSESPVSPNSFVTLDENESHHLQNVLRIKPGAPCRVLDGAGNEWTALVRSIAKDGKVQLEVLRRLESGVRRSYRLTIAQGIPQRGKMDMLVEKAAELGVNCLIPMKTERTMMKMNRDNEEKVIRRWDRIVQSARKQSGSVVETEVAKPMAFEEVLRHFSGIEHRFLLDRETGLSFFDCLHTLRLKISGGSQEEIAVLIGPEGGFSQKELGRAQESGIQAVRLGPSVLKTDTAFLTVAGAFCFGLS